MIAVIDKDEKIESAITAVTPRQVAGRCKHLEGVDGRLEAEALATASSALVQAQADGEIG
jgi:hypothetical protein